MQTPTFVNSAFYNLSRIGNDNCNLDQRNIQNINSSTYQTENYYPFCPMTKAIDFATNQPNVFYKGTHQVGFNGCNIDDNSKLKYSNMTKPACKINLIERPYLTIPYLGRGNVDPVLERQIKTGDRELNKKSLNPSSEVNLSEKKNYPIQTNIQNTLCNSNNFIEENIKPGWVRGGMSSRELAKNQNN